jgi:signal transduction histidine kinase
LFGDSERDLLGQFVLQIRLALQRTELQAANDAARAAAQAAYDEQQQMLVGLAHDLRSPTVTISTYSSLIADSDDLEDAKQMAEGLAGSAKYLDRLVDGISELSRIGRNDGQPEPVSLAQVVEQAATRLRVAYPDLRVEVVDELPTLLVDRLRIEQVLDNLIGNAAKHGGRPDLTVTVTTEPLDAASAWWSPTTATASPTRTRGGLRPLPPRLVRRRAGQRRRPRPLSPDRRGLRRRHPVRPRRTTAPAPRSTSRRAC